MNIQHSKIQDTFSPLILAYKMYSVHHDLIMSKSMTHPLVQYVSKQQCLKMELPYPLALQIVKQAKTFWISEMILNVQFQSTVVHCYSIPQLLVHKKQ